MKPRHNAPHSTRWRRSLGWVWLLALIFSGCAGAGSPTLPDDGPAPTISRAAAMRFVDKTLTAGRRTAQTRAFDLTVTDAEVTSFLNIRAEIARELQDAGREQVGSIEGLGGIQPDEVDVAMWQRLVGNVERDDGRLLPRLRLGLQEPSVYFTDDRHVIARGYITLLVWRQPARVVVAPYAADGELVFDFIEGQLGPLSMPEAVFDLIGQGLAEALLLGEDYVEVSRIQVEPGLLTVSGRYTQ